MLELASKAFLTFFVVIDPVGVVPMFVALAGNRPRLEQLRIARKAILVAGGVIVFFALVGGPLLEHLGISLEALRIAGGILLFRIAVDMVFAQWERETKEEQDEARERADISVFPLAIPLIAGPGTLASVLILAGESRRVELGLWIVLSMAAVVLVIAYFLLRVSSRLRFLLGRTGINVVTRVLGLLLAALAVQYVADGVRAFLEA
jgi:multiple antibiotic resistance protein